MESPDPILQKILDFASGEEDIRAVVMNGSRVNPNAPKDQYQDYDIVFYTVNSKEEKYKKDSSWVERFGQVAICQKNDFEKGNYIFLLQYFNGIRLDLSFDDYASVNQSIQEDSLSKVLLDKDQQILSFPQSNDRSYHVKKPSEQRWKECLNEIYWLQIPIAKALKRDEVLLAKFYYDLIVSEVGDLMSWYIGHPFNWKVNVGKANKWAKKFLDNELYYQYERILFCQDSNDLLLNLEPIQNITRRIGQDLSQKLGYPYPLEYDENVRSFLKDFEIIYPISE